MSDPREGASGEEAGGAAEPTVSKPRWRTRRNAIAALLIVQVALAIVALGVWIWTPDAPALPSLPTATAPLVDGGATYESALPLAQGQADAWLPGAVLLNAAMQVDWPWSVEGEEAEEIPPTGWLNYTFVAPWQPPGRPPGAASLSVVIERLSGAVVTQDTLGWEEAPQFHATPAAAEIDATEATLRAEAEGGTAFRRECPQFRHLTRTFPVAAGRTEWPQHWVIVYEDNRVPEQHGLMLRIDAETGDVLDRRSDAPSCDEEP